MPTPRETAKAGKKGHSEGVRYFEDTGTRGLQQGRTHPRSLRPSLLQDLGSSETRFATNEAAGPAGHRASPAPRPPGLQGPHLRSGKGRLGPTVRPQGR